MLVTKAILPRFGEFSIRISFFSEFQNGCSHLSIRGFNRQEEANFGFRISGKFPGFDLSLRSSKGREPCQVSHVFDVEHLGLFLVQNLAQNLELFPSFEVFLVPIEIHPFFFQ